MTGLPEIPVIDAREGGPLQAAENPYLGEIDAIAGFVGHSGA
jgi:hypothetical protein